MYRILLNNIDIPTLAASSSIKAMSLRFPNSDPFCRTKRLAARRGVFQHGLLPRHLEPNSVIQGIGLPEAEAQDRDANLALRWCLQGRCCPSLDFQKLPVY